MIIGSQRTIFGDETGADGRALTDTDLNAISVNMTRRAWEVPGYAYLTAMDEIFGPVGVQSYASAFECALHGHDARETGVFTIARGLEPYKSGLNVSVGAGFLGTWVDPTGPNPPPATGTNRMQWVAVQAGNISVDHVAADSGNTRWDVVYVTPSEVNGGSITRHFQDASTGVISSQTVVAGRAPTIAVGVLEGTQSSGTPDLPTTIPAGAKFLYAALVSSSAVTAVRDFTIPIGTLQVGLTLGREGVCSASDAVGSPVWLPAHNAPRIIYQPSLVGNLILLSPPHVRGSVSQRLLSLAITHRLYSGDTVEMCSYSQSGATESILDITGQLTIDGTPHTDYFNISQYSPIWMNGDQQKGDSGLSVGLKVNAQTANNSEVWSVRWCYV